MQNTKNKITFFNITSTIILQGLVFFSGPIFSGALGTNNYGIAAVYVTWVQLASTIFSLQAGSTIALARINYPIEEQENFQSSILTLSTVSYFTFSILTCVSVWLLDSFFNVNFIMLILGLFHGWGMYCVTFFNTKFTYEFKAHKNFFISVLTSVSTIGLSIFLISRFPKSINYWGRIIGLSSVYTFLGIIFFSYMIKSGKTFFNKNYWKFALPIAVPTIFHLLANILLNQSDKLMLQNLMGNSEAGVYALASTFGAVINTIWGALNNSWVPFYYEYNKKNEIYNIKKHGKNYIELFTLLTVGFILLSREVFYVYANKNFWSGSDFIPIFAVGYYFVFLYSFPVNYEFYNKKTKSIAIGTTLAAICNIILNFLFINWIGIIGAVIATAISHGIQFIFHYIAAIKIKESEFHLKMKDFLPGFMIVCICCVIYYLFKEQWVIRWIIGALLGIYLILSVVKRKEIF